MEAPPLGKTRKRGRCFSFRAERAEVVGRVIAHLFPRERGRRLIVRYVAHAWVHFPIAGAFNFESPRRFRAAPIAAHYGRRNVQDPLTAFFRFRGKILERASALRSFFSSNNQEIKIDRFQFALFSFCGKVTADARKYPRKPITPVCPNNEIWSRYRRCAVSSVVWVFHNAAIATQ